MAKFDFMKMINDKKDAAKGKPKGKAKPVVKAKPKAKGKK